MQTPTPPDVERPKPSMFGGVLDRLKRIKHIEWILMLLIAAVAITAFTSTLGNKAPSNDVLIQSADSGASTDQEVRLARVLEDMRGVGKVRVMIAYGSDETNAFGATTARTPVSAIVVAQGADDIAVHMELVRAVRTALNLPAQAVDVFSMGE